MDFDTQRLLTYPEKPGVYLMKDRHGAIIYIGKAKNLKSRVRQYFLPGRDERVQIPFLIAAVKDIETIIVGSEKEALLLEARLIRRFKPKYNILLKDDRSHLLIHLSMSHEWPKIEYLRSKNAASHGPRSFGPYSRTKDMFEMAVRLFQLRQCSDEEFKRRKSPCILYQLKRCSAPCVQKIDKKEYRAHVDHAADFLSGKISWVREQLYRDMQLASDQLEFEKADLFLQRIKLLDELASQQETGRVDGVQSCDVLGVCQEGQKGLAITLMHYRHGLLSYSEGWVWEREKDQLEMGRVSENVSSLVVQLYQSRLQEEDSGSASEERVSEILLPKEFEESRELIEEALSEIFKKKMTVKCPQIGPKAKIVKLAVENARARLWQKSGAKERAYEILAEMALELGLKKIPQSIDCFDASHFGGKQLVATCISFEGGLPNKKRYRTFKAKSTKTADDGSMIQEAIFRRYKIEKSISSKNKDGGPTGEEESNLPDLIIIDGGKTQLNAARDALLKLGIIGVDLIALTKEQGRHDKGMTGERVFFLNRDEPLSLSVRSSALHFLQRIRDEAHRFSIEFQKKQRVKILFKSSLDDIPGIGIKKRQKLLTVFSGVKSIVNSSVEEIAAKAGISLQDAHRIKNYLFHSTHSTE